VKAKVDPELCIGCELCVATCPEVFSMNNEGKAVAISDVVAAPNAAACEQAAKDCPVEAILLE
jgi:ferredoxin